MVLTTPAPAATGLALRIEALVHGYPNRRLFDGFSAEAGPGITWVQGPNGCGKSTLLQLLAGAQTPLRGRFTLDGCSFGAGEAEATPAWRAQTFWCASDPPPTPWLTVGETLSFVSGAWPGAQAEALQAQVRAFGLEAALATPLRQASLGQQRKTLLALALALPVKLLLLDEPFNALDAASSAHLAATLSARAEAGTQVVLLTSHVAPHVPVRDTWNLGA